MKVVLVHSSRNQDMAYRQLRTENPFSQAVPMIRFVRRSRTLSILTSNKIYTTSFFTSHVSTASTYTTKNVGLSLGLYQYLWFKGFCSFFFFSSYFCQCLFVCMRLLNFLFACFFICLYVCVILFVYVFFMHPEEGFFPFLYFLSFPGWRKIGFMGFIILPYSRKQG